MIRTPVALIFAALLLFQDSQPVPQAEFYFARLKYPGIRDETYIKNYYTDYPQADEHFVVLANRLTGIKAAKALVHIDDNIFQYPFIYIVEPAQMNLTDVHILKMQEYVARGGFLMLDDIHGDADMTPVREILHRILGEDDSLYEISSQHEIFHTYYDIPDVIQVLHDGIAMCFTCLERWESGPTGKDPRVLAHLDWYGNVNILVMENNDVADGMQWLDDPLYPREMAIWSVKMFLNTSVYALSH